MKKIKGNTYLYENAVCQGGYQVNNHWLIVDAGGNESNAKKSIKGLETPIIDYVFDTHFHADHCGGNTYFQTKLGAKIIAPSLECVFIESPILEPIYLYGAYPPVELQNRFLMAKASTVDIVVDGDDLTVDLDGQSIRFTTLHLGGHSPNMLGLVTPDNIAFVGDAIIDAKNIEKHPLIFTFNIQDHIETLERMKSFHYDGYVLAHGGYYEDINELIEINLQAIVGMADQIESIILESPISVEGIHQRLAESLSLEENLSTYTLNHSVIKAHVQYLIDMARIKTEVIHGKLLLGKID